MISSPCWLILPTPAVIPIPTFPKMNRYHVYKHNPALLALLWKIYAGKDLPQTDWLVTYFSFLWCFWSCFTILIHNFQSMSSLMSSVGHQSCMMLLMFYCIHPLSTRNESLHTFGLLFTWNLRRETATWGQSFSNTSSPHPPPTFISWTGAESRICRVEQSWWCNFTQLKLESDEIFKLCFRFLSVPRVGSSEFASVQTENTHIHIIFITHSVPPSLSLAPSGSDSGIFVTLKEEYLDFPAAVETTAGLFPLVSSLLIHRFVSGEGWAASFKAEYAVILAVATLRTELL